MPTNTTEKATHAAPAAPVLKTATKEDLANIKGFLAGFKMDESMAVLAFGFAIAGAEYLKGSSQTQVNKDYEAEMPNYTAKRDINAGAIHDSERTRKSYEKLSRSLNRAIEVTVQ